MVSKEEEEEEEGKNVRLVCELLRSLEILGSPVLSLFGCG